MQKSHVTMEEQAFGIDQLGRRENPDYSRVTGLVNRELARRLRIFVATAETTISEVVETALQKYLDEVEGENDTLKGSQPKIKNKKDQGAV